MLYGAFAEIGDFVFQIDDVVSVLAADWQRYFAFVESVCRILERIYHIEHREGAEVAEVLAARVLSWQNIIFDTLFRVFVSQFIEVFACLSPFVAFHGFVVGFQGVLCTGVLVYTYQNVCSLQSIVVTLVGLTKDIVHGGGIDKIRSCKLVTIARQFFYQLGQRVELQSVCILQFGTVVDKEFGVFVEGLSLFVGTCCRRCFGVLAYRAEELLHEFRFVDFLPVDFKYYRIVRVLGT